MAIRTTADVLIDVLNAHGVRHIFNLPGAGMGWLWSSAYERQRDVKLVTALSETSLAFMADGFGRVSPSPSFSHLYQSPGLCYALAALHTGCADNSRMLVTAGTNSHEAFNRDSYANHPEDLASIARPFTKWSFEPATPQRTLESVAHGLYLASTPPYGPVFLGLPKGLLGEKVDDSVATPDQAIGALRHPFKRIVASQLPAKHIADIVDRLMNAEQPVIVAGGEVAQAQAIESLTALSDLGGIPVVWEPFPAYIGMPPAHELNRGFFRHNQQLLKEADLILNVGARLTRAGGGAPNPLPRGPFVIKMTCDPREVETHGKVDLALIGEVKGLVAQVFNALSERTAELDLAAITSRKEEALTARRLWHQQVREQLQRAKLLSTGNVAAVEFAMALGKEVESIADKLVLFEHSTATGNFILTEWRFLDPYRYFSLSGRGSCQGWGLPAAIGAQFARPDEKVISIIGDGNFLWNSASLWTAAQHHLPLTAFVVNNGGWRAVRGAIRREVAGADSTEEVEALELALGFEFGPISYTKIAESYGVPAARVCDRAELSSAIRTALSHSGPFLVEVVTDSESGTI